MIPILVTGGAKGLGAHISLELASQGHDVVIHYRTSQVAAHLLAQECRSFNVKAETIQGDFTTQESLNQFIARYTGLFSQSKGLVNNVGSYLLASSEKTTSAQWLELFQINFFAPVFLTQALLPSLRASQGSIMNVGQIGLESKRGFVQTMAYATSKAALHSYTVSLAKELATDRIRVNMVSPGYMENAVDLPNPDLLPMRRAATLQEVGRIIASFFSLEMAYITGQNLEIAGAFGL
jgi:NAD(P)-dependent dehydrogenase (short-subunit alcohol dehydrogenase family)